MRTRCRITCSARRPRSSTGAWLRARRPGVADERGMSGAELARSTSLRLQWAGLLCNGVGAVIVAGFILFLAPNTIPSDRLWEALAWNTGVFAVFLPITLALGRQWANIRPFKPLKNWLRQERPAGEAERLLVLRYPKIWVLKSAALWGFGA